MLTFCTSLRPVFLVFFCRDCFLFVLNAIFACFSFSDGHRLSTLAQRVSYKKDESTFSKLLATNLLAFFSCEKDWLCLSKISFLCHSRCYHSQSCHVGVAFSIVLSLNSSMLTFCLLLVNISCLLSVRFVCFLMACVCLQVNPWRESNSVFTLCLNQRNGTSHCVCVCVCVFMMKIKSKWQQLLSAMSSKFCYSCHSLVLSLRGVAGRESHV